MNELDNYIVSLKNFKESEIFRYSLTDDFFSAVESSDVQKGAVEATLTVTKRAMFFEFLFQMRGTVEVPCDRCLEPMALALEAEKAFQVKLGDEFCDEGDDTIIASATDEEINVAWLMYEIIALHLPLQHMHAEGECEPTMADCLQRCLVDENFTDESENKTTDPRWEGLRNILDE